jgi:hypothetical protein
VGPRTGLDDRKFLTLPGLELQPSVIQPVASRSTDCAIPAHRELYVGFRKVELNSGGSGYNILVRKFPQNTTVPRLASACTFPFSHIYYGKTTFGKYYEFKLEATMSLVG